MTVVRFVMEGSGDPLFSVSSLKHPAIKNDYVKFAGTTYKIEKVTLEINQVAASDGMKGHPPLGFVPPEYVVVLSVVP